MEISKSITNITVDGKSYGSAEEMDSATRKTYEEAMGQIVKISETSNKVTTNLSVGVGSNVVDVKSNNGMMMFVLGLLVGGGLVYFFGGGKVSSQICPLITDKSLCETMGCVAEPVNIMPAPGKPGWFCVKKM